MQHTYPLIKPTWFGLCWISLLSSSPAWAEAITLPSTIVSANRIEQSADRYTGEITVISSEQLQEKSITTLPEALDRIAGVPMVSNGGLGQATSLFLHGHDSKRTLVLIDGMRFNDPTSPSGPQWQHLLVSDIDRIEIIEGAQAGIWGADAAAGVVNIITKRAQSGTHAALTYALGNLGQKQTQANVSFANSTFDARLGYTGLSSDEFSSITPISNGYRQNPESYEKDGYQNDTISLKLGAQLSQQQRLEVSAYKVDASGYDDLFNAPNSFSQYSYQQRTLGAQYQAHWQNWQFTAALQQGDIIREHNNSSRFNAQTQQQNLIAQHKDNSGDWTMGIDFSEQSSDLLNSSAIGKAQKQTGSFISRSQQLALISAQLPTLLNISLRNDDFSDYQSYVGKRIGIKQTLAPETYIAFNYADTRRMPNLWERFVQYDANYAIIPRNNAGELHPETVDSKEITLAWKGLSLTRFEDHIQSLIDYDMINSNYYNRAGTSQLSGWVWKYQQQLSQLSSEVTLSYQLLDAKDDQGIILARRPDTQLNASWTYLGFTHTQLGLQTQYIGNRYDSVTAAQKGPNTGDVWLWHAYINYQWDKHLRLFAKGINLTDERIAQATDSYAASAPTHYYAYTPRSVLAGVEYRF